DNVFWGGRVAHPSVDDAQTRAIRALNAKACRDERVETSIVPLGDGVLLTRKRPAPPAREAGAPTVRVRAPVELAIADSHACAAACGEIYAQRSRWRAHRLNDQAPFYTLGTASYLALGFEGATVDEYLREAGSLWQWAGDAITAIVERVRAAVDTHRRQRVDDPAVLPPPGFHIFVGGGIPRNDCARTRSACASCHFGLQHPVIPWERWYREVDLPDTISFPLPLKLPAAGG